MVVQAYNPNTQGTEAGQSNTPSTGVAMAIQKDTESRNNIFKKAKNFETC